MSNTRVGYSLTHLDNETLLRNLQQLVARDRATTAALIAHLAEFDARRLYAPIGYSSMFGYCVRELRLSEDIASKRIRVARAARRFPVIFDGLADGCLHVSGVALITRHLTQENGAELLAFAVGKTYSEIETELARRFPGDDAPTRIQPLASSATAATKDLPATWPVRNLASSASALTSVEAQRLATPDAEPVAQQVAAGSKVTCDSTEETKSEIAQKPEPAPEKYVLQVTISKATREKLEYAQALLSHQVRPGDVATVLDRALDVLIAKLEKAKFAATDRPRTTVETRSDTRHIPAHVKRAVMERDGGQCTFVGATGKRCESRQGLEFDHILEFARGGAATVENIRQRCRQHNQLCAERTYGAEFMASKRAKRRSAAKSVDSSPAAASPG